VTQDYADHLVEEVRAGRISRRDLIRRASVAGLSLPAVSMLVTACGGNGDSSAQSGTPASGGKPRRGGTARLGVIVPGSDVDPVTMFSSGSTLTAQITGEYLCYPRADFTLEPKLATKWDSKDPRVWTFTLRQGVKWHDGTPLTAEDVVATFDRLTDPKTESSALATYKGILAKGDTEKVDEQTVRFHLRRPYVDFPYLVSGFSTQSIILPKDYELGSFTKGGIGTGPYVLKQYTPKQGASFVRNEAYWDAELPYLDAIELKYFPDTAPAVLALQGNEIDVFPDTPFQGSQPLLSDSNIKVLENPSSQYRSFHMRVDTAPFDDKRVRQAVALCLDRKALVEGLFGGRAEVGADHGFAPVFPPSPGADVVAPREQNHEQARQLLADAGHPDGLTVNITTEQYVEIPQYAVLIQEQCKPAGIDVKLKILEQSAYYGDGDDQPWLTVPVGISDWGARGSASQLILPAYTCDGVWNSAHWCNKQFETLLHDFDAEIDEGKRKQIGIEAAKVQAEETPAVIAYWLNELRATRSTVHGLANGPAGRIDPARMWLSA
jgi:peptide/nickel transport system substrate-binding protein